MHSVRSSFALVAIAFLAASAACSADRAVVDSKLPAARAGASAEIVGELAGLIDVAIATGGSEMRLLFPGSDECREVVAGEAASDSEGASPLRYENVGPWGRLRLGESTCEPVGIMDLEAWRRRRPRPSDSSVTPSGRSEYSIVHQDDDYALARGRFPLVGYLGWTGGEDTVAVLPKTDHCASALAATRSSIVYKPAGRPALALTTGRTPCGLAGLVQPQALGN